MQAKQESQMRKDLIKQQQDWEKEELHRVRMEQLRSRTNDKRHS